MTLLCTMMVASKNPFSATVLKDIDQVLNSPSDAVQLIIQSLLTFPAELKLTTLYKYPKD